MNTPPERECGLTPTAARGWAHSFLKKDTDAIRRAELPADMREAVRTIGQLRAKLDKRAMVTNAFIEAIEHIWLEAPPVVEVPAAPHDFGDGPNEEIAVLHLSDIHFGKHTQTYNTEIAGERIKLLADKVNHITNIRRNGAKIKELRVYFGGDFVEGENIFSKQILHVDSGVLQQAIYQPPIYLARMLLSFLGNFEKVTVKAVPGNHGRPGRFRDLRHPLTDWDRVMYEYTKALLVNREEMGPNYHDPYGLEKDGRLAFDVVETWYYVDRVFDWGNLVVHGDQIRGGFAGFPFYGVAKKAWGWGDVVPELERIHGRYGHWDYLWFGHFHTYTSGNLNFKTFLANGTVESHNSFAAQELASAGAACQRLAFFDDEHGLISDNQIFLEPFVPALKRHATPPNYEIVGPEYAGM